jgi:hypothetical protein
MDVSGNFTSIVAPHFSVVVVLFIRVGVVDVVQMMSGLVTASSLSG